MPVPASLAEAQALDAADPLGAFRARFALPEGQIYLDGNSLGALPAATPGRIADVVALEWGERLVGSWEEWAGAPQRIGDKIARLIGAQASEVIATDSTSVNLYKLVIAAAELRKGAIVAERDNFPSDAYVAQRAAALLGRELRLVDGAAMADAVRADVAVAVITHVNYRTAARADIAALEAQAAATGTRIVWDLSHSIGAVPLALGEEGARLAVGCGYKYLNGGPGATAWAYVRGDLQAQLVSPIAGWWSHADPFAFTPEHAPAGGIERFLAGTPAVLSLLALEVGVDLMLEAAGPALWAKAAGLFDLFAARIDAECPELIMVSPRAATRRGSHISFAHPHAHAIVRALIARGVVGDFRTPDVARFGLTPLYVGWGDVWRATAIMAEVVAARPWEGATEEARGRIT